MRKGNNPETYFFDIPIYWCEVASFNAKYDQKLKSYEEKAKEYLSAKGLEFKPNEEDRRRTHIILWARSMCPWRFNQIVGWIRVYRFGNQLRGEYWLIKAKRFGWQLRKRQFIPRGKAFEMCPNKEESAEEIFKRMIQNLRTFNKELRGRVIDLESFENLGRYVDWRRLVDAERR